MGRTLLLATTLVIFGTARDADIGGTPLPRLLPAQQPVAIPSRNMVNLVEKNLPTSWSIEENKFKNIKWTADLGSQTFGSPIVARGKVFVATNNKKPGNIDKKEPKAVLMALRESDGAFLWQITHDYPESLSPYARTVGGMVSTPAIDGDNLYYVTAAGEVICADATEGKVAWRYDMMKQLAVVPCMPFCDLDLLPLGSPLVVDDLVFVTTGNGTDDEGKLVSPKAPSFVALKKKTGQLVWQSNLPGGNIIEGQWSSPVYAVVNNVPQVIFGGGDGVIYALEPESGKLIWKCKCNPSTKKKEKGEIDSYVIGAPVVVGNRLYVGLGRCEYPKSAQSSYFLCLDITKQGDVSFISYDVRSPGNKNSALVWAFGGLIQPRPEKGRRARFRSTISTAAMHDGLVYISERGGYLHCLDANTGERYWVDDLKDSVLGSPFWVDGRVYLGTEDGEVRIYTHGKSMGLLAKIAMDEVIQTSPAAANGVLFVMTKSKLYAIK